MLVIILFNNFLEFQWNFCVSKTLVSNHIIFLSFLAYFWGFPHHTFFYSIFLLVMIILLSVSERFPKGFGVHYINFLKKFSSPETFSRYCGDSFEQLKGEKGGSFIKKIWIKGVCRVLGTFIFVLLNHHVLHHYAKIGQRYEHLLTDFMNNETTSIVYKDSGPSLLDRKSVV